MTRTAQQFRALGWTVSTIRLSPATQLALAVIQSRTHENASTIVRRLILEEALEYTEPQEVES